MKNLIEFLAFPDGVKYRYPAVLVDRSVAFAYDCDGYVAKLGMVDEVVEYLFCVGVIAIDDGRNSPPPEAGIDVVSRYDAAQGEREDREEIRDQKSDGDLIAAIGLDEYGKGDAAEHESVRDAKVLELLARDKKNARIELKDVIDQEKEREIGPIRDE